MSGQTVQQGIATIMSIVGAQPFFALPPAFVGALQGWHFARWTGWRLCFGVAGFVGMAALVGYLMILTADYFSAQGGWIDAQAGMSDAFLVGIWLGFLIVVLAGLLPVFVWRRLNLRRSSMSGGQ